MTHSLPSAADAAHEELVLGEDGLVLEGLLTTFDPCGTVRVAPMGPLVDRTCSRMVLRPFQSSATYANLKRERTGVFHVTDRVEQIAHAALQGLPEPPRWTPTPSGTGAILDDACRWYAFDVEVIDDSQQRATLRTRIVDRGCLREFFGFNRAMHAVVEAAILATRVGLTPIDEIRHALLRLEPLVLKTGAATERRVFQTLRQGIEDAWDAITRDHSQQ